MIVDATLSVSAGVVAVSLHTSAPLPDGRTEVRYTVAVGEPGRHGHQGFIAADWATFDGSVLVAPPGVVAEDTVRITFDVPDGWSVASPIPVEGAPWSVAAASCYGLGRFESHDVAVAGSSVRVWAYSGLGSSRIRDLFEGSDALFRWFHDELGFSPTDPYVVVLTPRAPDGEGVFGGTSARGTCFDHDGARRGWELLSHRIGHAIDRYPPAGFQVADARDAWFVEGWATYAEVVATEATGLAPDRRHLDELAAVHRAELARHPDWRVPLASEPSTRGDLQEHLHYVAGPLAAARLDAELLERTGRSLQAFVRHLYTGRAGQRVALREELRAWSGLDLDGFWAREVDGATASPP